MTMTTSNQEQIGKGTTDGMVVGPALDAAGNPFKQSFYGATPQPQYPSVQTQASTRIGEVRMFAVSASTGAHNATSAPEETMTASSLATDSCLYISRCSTTPGIAVSGYRVSAANTFGVTLLNVSTAATIVPVSTQGYRMIEFRAGGGFVTTVALSPASVTTSTTAEQSFTVPGAMPGQMVVVNKPTAQTALSIANARVSGVSTVAIAFANISSAPITPTPAETYVFALVPPLAAASPIVQYAVPATTIAAAVGISTSVEQSTTLMNLNATDFYVGCTIPAAQAGVYPVQGRIDVTSGVLALSWANNSSGSLTPTSSAAIGVTILRSQATAPVQVITTTFPATSVPASTTIEFSSAVVGMPSSSVVFVNKLFHTAGIGVANAHCSTAGQATLALFNTATTTVQVPSGQYMVGYTPAVPSWGTGASAYNSSGALASTCAYMSYTVDPNVGTTIRDMRARDSANGLMPS